LLLDDAQYLLIRLCLRKSGKWQRLSSLKYRSELGSKLESAVKKLCLTTNTTFSQSYPSEVDEVGPVKTIVKKEEEDAVDIIFNHEQFNGTKVGTIAEREHVVPAASIAGPSSVKLEDLKQTPDENLTFFAEDHTHASLSDMLDCLTIDELKNLAKQMKIKTIGTVRT